MKLRILFVVAASVLLAADAPKEDAAKKDKEKLQGTWKLVVAEKDGEKRDREDLEKVRLVIAGDKLTIKDPRLGMEEMTYRLGPSKKPKEIDLKGSEAKEVSHGIYRLEGDELKICWAEPNKGRPADFSAKAKSGRILVVGKRVKP